jgi:hypothetical protein
MVMSKLHQETEATPRPANSCLYAVYKLGEQ